ncbi:hypothetical protein RDJLphi1_gp73 [Roseobacter phage RDJL Phi 1]|uniref:DUF2190 domain-containing protein n=1 Tax=Roseobacter phage RDJL Phi 1 TaxID=562742 RepID=F4YXT4_9CAUD|nr:hypothetical protein RDJLphi1_gp73 [Roseobacter phage RDJL Phi 1]ADK73474.1 hypothetical protein RDJLphi1_gp73 [Roseobacter phage RDJL Phi 1]
MSYESTQAVTLIAGEDLRGDVYELLQFENDGGVAKVIKVTAVTDTAIGILAEEPDAAATTDGQAVSVVMLGSGGRAMVKAGATITAGQLVVADATAGRVAGVADIAALVADSMAIGVALESAVDGDIFEVLLQPISSATET